MALTPQAVGVLVQRGHTVFVEKGAGLGSGISDSEYENAGARLVRNEKELFSKAKLIVKVKEPIAEEYSLIAKNHIMSSLKLTAFEHSERVSK